MFSVVIKGGDAITLVSELLHINAYEAAKNLNTVFNLGVDFGTKISNMEFSKYNAKLKLVKDFQKWEKSTFIILCKYYHLLEEWEKLKNPDNNFYIIALHEKNKIDYYIEIFLEGTNKDKIWFWRENKNVINKIKNILINIERGEKNE